MALFGQHNLPSGYRPLRISPALNIASRTRLPTTTDATPTVIELVHCRGMIVCQVYQEMVPEMVSDPPPDLVKLCIPDPAPRLPA
jgi:hypothetical protein